MSELRIQYPCSGEAAAYEMFDYPAGELQVRLKPHVIPLVHAAETIQICARVKGSEALIGLLLLSNAIRGVKPAAVIDLLIPYLPYARADRRFVDGDCYGLQQFGPILRLGCWQRIVTLDVHNHIKATAHVSSFLVNLDPLPYITRALSDFVQANRLTNEAILFPDAGAGKRYRIPGYERSFVGAKERVPQTGKLSGFEVPDLANYDGVLIVDDICDGGGTFLGIAECLRRTAFRGPIALYVSHGIFSKGLFALRNHFEQIYTTNSFSEGSPDPWLTVYDAWELTK